MNFIQLSKLEQQLRARESHDNRSPESAWPPRTRCQANPWPAKQPAACWPQAGKVEPLLKLEFLTGETNCRAAELLVLVRAGSTS
jgi:hypothetical protein